MKLSKPKATTLIGGRCLCAGCCISDPARAALRERLETEMRTHLKRRLRPVGSAR